MPIDPATGLPTSSGYSVLDLAYGVTYRAPANAGAAQATNYSSTRSYRASLTYATGSHTAKFGFNLINGPLEIPQFMGAASNDSALAFQAGVPIALIRYATPTVQRANLDADLGVFAQDQWQINRFTLNLGLRFDWLKESVPAQHFDAGTWVAGEGLPGGGKCSELEGSQSAPRDRVRRVRHRKDGIEGIVQPIPHPGVHRDGTSE